MYSATSLRMDRRQYGGNSGRQKYQPEVPCVEMPCLLWSFLDVYVFFCFLGAVVREHERAILVVSLADRDPTLTCQRIAQHMIEAREKPSQCRPSCSPILKAMSKSEESMQVVQRVLTRRT